MVMKSIVIATLKEGIKPTSLFVQESPNLIYIIF